MAYYDFAPTDIDETLSQLASFCTNDLGWSADYSGGELTITPKSGEALFTLSEGDINSSTALQDPDPGPSIIMEMTEGSDYIKAAIGSIKSTSLVWFHGGNDPEPWLLITILSEPGIYRHGFLGYVARYGTWSGGAICDGVFWAYVSTASDGQPVDYPKGYANADCHMLFSSNTGYSRTYVDNGVHYSNGTFYDTNLDGGVFVRGVHGESPVARFKRDENAYPAPYPRVGGGFLDDYAARARDPGVFPLSGEAALVPITLFADMLRNDTWTPIGHVPGIRMVNIADFGPEELYTYAGLTWRIFPLARKTSGYYHTGNHGIAVLQED